MLEWKYASQFRYMMDARSWCANNASGPCTIVVHGDPYEYKRDHWEEFVFDHYILERQYTWSFYMK